MYQHKSFKVGGTHGVGSIDGAGDVNLDSPELACVCTCKDVADLDSASLAVLATPTRLSLAKVQHENDDDEQNLPTQ